MVILDATRDLIETVFGERPAVGLAELATRLGCHRESLRRAASRGRLPAVKVGGRWRVTREGLRAYCTEAHARLPQRIPPAAPPPPEAWRDAGDGGMADPTELGFYGEDGYVPF